MLTHLDFDHAGGIGDFPEATVHVLDAELDAATSRSNLLDRGRYRPMQWDGPVAWQPYTCDGERWFGFTCVRGLVGLPSDILLVPLAGHTLGHCGIAVRTHEGWLLHAGDAYFFRGEMDTREYQCTPMLRFYQRMTAADDAMRLGTKRGCAGSSKPTAATSVCSARTTQRSWRCFRCLPLREPRLRPADLPSRLSRHRLFRS